MRGRERRDEDDQPRDERARSLRAHDERRNRRPGCADDDWIDPAVLGPDEDGSEHVEDDGGGDEHERRHEAKGGRRKRGGGSERHAPILSP